MRSNLRGSLPTVNFNLIHLVALVSCTFFVACCLGIYVGIVGENAELLPTPGGSMTMWEINEQEKAEQVFPLLPSMKKSAWRFTVYEPFNIINPKWVTGFVELEKAETDRIIKEFSWKRANHSESHLESLSSELSHINEIKMMTAYQSEDFFAENFKGRMVEGKLYLVPNVNLIYFHLQGNIFGPHEEAAKFMFICSHDTAIKLAESFELMRWNSLEGATFWPENLEFSPSFLSALYHDDFEAFWIPANSESSGDGPLKDGPDAHISIITRKDGGDALVAVFGVESVEDEFLD